MISNAEATATGNLIDILSNGFKMQGTHQTNGMEAETK